MKDMPRTPTAVIQWLERRFRDRWTRGEHRQVELSGSDGGPIQVRSSARESVAAKLEEMHARGVFTRPATVERHEERPDNDVDGTEQPSDEVRHQRPRRTEHKGPSFA